MLINTRATYCQLRLCCTTWIFFYVALVAATKFYVKENDFMVESIVIL